MRGTGEYRATNKYVCPLTFDFVGVWLLTPRHRRDDDDGGDVD